LLTKGIEVVMPHAAGVEHLTLLVRQQLAAVEEYSNARTAWAAAKTEQQWSARFCVCRDLFHEIKDIAGEIHLRRQRWQ